MKILWIVTIVLLIICIESNANSVAIIPHPTVIINNGKEIGFFINDDYFVIYSTKNWEQVKKIKIDNSCQYQLLKPYNLLFLQIKNGFAAYDVKTWKQCFSFTMPDKYITNTYGFFINKTSDDKYIILSRHKILFLFEAHTGKLLKTSTENDFYNKRYDKKIFQFISDKKILSLKYRKTFYIVYNFSKYSALRLSAKQDFIFGFLYLDEMHIKKQFISYRINNNEVKVFNEIINYTGRYPVTTENNCLKYIVGKFIKQKKSPGNIAWEGRIFNPQTGEFEIIWDSNKWQYNNKQYYQAAISAMAFEKGLNWGICTSYNYITKIYDLKTGKVIKKFDFSKNY
jgi:hypothetical protein